MWLCSTRVRCPSERSQPGGQRCPIAFSLPGNKKFHFSFSDSHIKTVLIKHIFYCWLCKPAQKKPPENIRRPIKYLQLLFPVSTSGALKQFPFSCFAFSSHLHPALPCACGYF